MNISGTWANYALITGACLVGYYLVVGVVYYRKDLLRLARFKKEPTLYVRKQPPLSTNAANHEQSLISDDFSAYDDEVGEGNIRHEHSTIEDFMDEVYAYTQACESNITKEELSINLRRILHKYPSLINSSLRNILAGIIATASQTNCSIQWHEDELNELWNG